MNEQQLLEECRALIRDLFGPRVPKHDNVAGARFYAHDEKLDYLDIGIDHDGTEIRFKVLGVGRNFKQTQQEIAVAYMILALIKDMVKDVPRYEEPQPEPVELTLDDIAELKGVDVSRIKVVESSH